MNKRQAKKRKKKLGINSEKDDVKKIVRKALSYVLGDFYSKINDLLSIMGTRFL